MNGRLLLTLLVGMPYGLPLPCNISREHSPLPEGRDLESRRSLNKIKELMKNKCILLSFSPCSSLIQIIEEAVYLHEAPYSVYT